MLEKLKIFLLIIILATICGCSSQEISTSPNKPEADDLENLIQVTFVNGPSIQASQNLSFRIQNMSDHCMVFPYDFGIKLWVDINGDWQEINNMMQYSPEENIFLEPAESIFSVKAVALFPDLSDFQLNQETNFKATITARLCDDDSVVIEKQILFSIMP